MAVLVKHGQSVTGLWNIIFFRSVFAILILLPSVLRQKPVMGHRRRLLFFRGFFGFLANIFGFYALGNMVLVDATMIIQTSPIFILIFSHYWLNERIGRVEMVLMMLGFSGVLFVIKPEFGLIPVPALAALAGSLCMAIAHTIIRALGKTERSSIIVFYYTIVTATGSFVPMLVEGNLPDYYGFAVIAGITITGTTGQTLVTMAYRLHRAGNVAMIRYLSLPLSALFGFVFFYEIPDFYSWLGLIIILSALTLMEKYHRSRKGV